MNAFEAGVAVGMEKVALHPALIASGLGAAGGALMSGEGHRLRGALAGGALGAGAGALGAGLTGRHALKKSMSPEAFKALSKAPAEQAHRGISKFFQSAKGEKALTRMQHVGYGAAGATGLGTGLAMRKMREGESK